MSYDYLFKFIIVGDTGVGKTCFVDRFVNNEFNPAQMETIGVDFRSNMVTLDDNAVIKSHIWDTAGQEKFASIIRSYYSGIAGAIIVFDVGKKESWEHVEFWRKEIMRNRSSKDPLVTLLIGNKIDSRKKRMVSRTEAEAYALQHNMLYAESSSKLNQNVTESFEWLVMETYERMDRENPGCGIKRSVAYQESIKLINQSKGRDCYYLGDKCPRNCCIII